MPVEADLHDQLAVALKVAGADAGNGIAKIIVSAGTGPRGYARADGTEPRVFVGVFPSDALARHAYEDGVDAIVCQTRLAGPSALAGLKTLNRLEQVLGRSECAAVNAFEGLMMDADERVICGTMSNVFIVIGHTIITPSLERCGVAGVMRRQVLELFSGSDRAITIRDVALEELMGSDEVFLSNSQFGVVPLRRCADRQWPPGGSTRECQRLLAKQGVQECAL
jgi:4-amino-4-deoxychorismate lyase